MSATSRLLVAGLVSAAASLLIVAPANAQSFNIDIDGPGNPPTLGGGVPSPTFGGAAGQPGFWNSYHATSNPVSLFDLAGAATGVTVQVTASSTTVSVLGFNNPAQTGDFALLFNDGSQIGTVVQGGSRTYTFTGLADGPYSVVTYTAKPQGDNGEIQVEVIGSPEGPIIATGVPTPNTFELGVTHVIHTIDVTDGTINIRMVDFPGAPSAYTNGFQLTLIPEPAALALALLPMLALRRRR